MGIYRYNFGKKLSKKGEMGSKMFDIVITMSLHLIRTSAEFDRKYAFPQRKRLASPHHNTSTNKKP